MNKRIIGMLGVIGSGKGSIGDYLVSAHNFHKLSFADSLKDSVSAIFRWPRNLLEGDTVESREWRENRDEWWSNKFGHTVTPRWVLQNLGTDVLRNHFFDNIWIASLEKKLEDIKTDVVITDVRFPNEIQLLRDMGGQLWHVSRADPPIWWTVAVNAPDSMPAQFPNIHSSEYLWAQHGPFISIRNDGDLRDLYKKIDELL
jgi:hypothetical protein